MVAGIMAQAQDLQAKIGLFPPAKEGTIIRRVMLLIQKAEYKPEQNTALVDVWYGSPPAIEHEFFTFADYWNDVMGVLQRASRLGEKAKTVLGFEHALHTYYCLKMSEAEQVQYKGLYDHIARDLQALTGTILGEARAQEQAGKLDYVITLSVLPSKGFVPLCTGEQRNFQVLEDRLFLDPEQLRNLKDFLWTAAASKAAPCIVQLTGLKYHLPHVSFT